MLNFIDTIDTMLQNGWPCLFRLTTGLYCPGCGGTRAVRELLHLHLLKSVLYNPMILYFAAGAILLAAALLLPRITGGRIKVPYTHGYAVAAVLLAAVNFLIKNYILLCRGIDPMLWIQTL